MFNRSAHDLGFFSTWFSLLLLQFLFFCLKLFLSHLQFLLSFFNLFLLFTHPCFHPIFYVLYSIIICTFLLANRKSQFPLLMARNSNTYANAFSNINCTQNRHVSFVLAMFCIKKQKPSRWCVVISFNATMWFCNLNKNVDRHQLTG